MKPLIPTIIVAAALFMLSAARAEEPTPPATPEPATVPAVPTIAQAQAAAEKARAEEQEEKATQEVEKSRPASRGNRNRNSPLAVGQAFVPAAPTPVTPPLRVQRLGRDSGGGKPLVIRSANTDPKEQTNLEEDLAVMTHIFDKSLDDLPGGRPRGGIKAAGIDVVFAPGLTPMRTLYLDGYGALFLLNVNFPLVPPPQKSEREKPAVDSAWTEAHEELFGQDEKGSPGMFDDYNEEKVSKLKESLFESLKNATNIRGLKAEDSVTVCVFGSSSGSARAKAKAKKAALMAKEDGAMLWTTDGPLDGQARQTVLTLRVKKSDIDSYAKGKLNLDEFQKRARSTAYVSGTAGGSFATGFGGFGYSFGDNRF